MRNRRAEFAVLLATMSLVLMIYPLFSHARAPKPASKPAREVATQPPPDRGIELAALRQQVKEQQQLMEALRGQFEVTRRAVKALGTRLDARQTIEDALLGQLEDLHQEGRRQRNLLYGAIGAIIVLGLLIRLQDLYPNYRTRNRRLARVRDDGSAVP
jgi:hypothetical protein